MKYIAFITLLLLAACGSDKSPEVSRHGDYTPSGMTYGDFRTHADKTAKEAGGAEWEQRHTETASGNAALHKRFMALDRNNDGRLSPSEYAY